VNNGLRLRNVGWNVFDDISYCRSIATKKGTREMRDLIILFALPFIGVWVIVGKITRLFRKAQEK
jgi:hypothetical protein